MAECLKAHTWKARIGETLSWVRIPFSPPLISNLKIAFSQKNLKIENFFKKSNIILDNPYLFKLKAIRDFIKNFKNGIKDYFLIKINDKK